VIKKQNWMRFEAGRKLLAHRLVFVGHVSIDRIENINGTRVQPGGAALYAAMAARTLSTNVVLISAVGKDYDFSDTLKLLDSKDVKTYNMPSTRFHIKYNKRWEARYLKTIHGAGSKITSRTISETWLRSKSMFHISPMRPAKVARILDKLRKQSPETKVSIMTWVDYIKEGRRSRETLKDLAMKADFFILNDSEAKALAQTDSLSSALRLLKAKMLIVTLGSLGAIISGEKIGIQMIPALNIPPEKIVDTTGAGDVWCGAFLATYNLTEDLTKSVSVASIISSVKCSNWGFNNLVNLRFKEPNDVIEFVIGLKEGGLQKRISDYITK
jgi:sugar/nucleoside kinase (ribokinase family)